MPKEHKIQQGETIGSIAAENGLQDKTIWDHPDNKEVVKECKTPNTLKPGLILKIPDKEVKEEDCPTDTLHRFRKKSGMAKLKLELKEEGEARADLKYILEVDGKLIEGKTDGEGVLEQSIPANAKKGVLHIGETEKIPLEIGKLNPVADLEGAQARLNNLGYECGEPDGKKGPKTEAALRSFQANNKLDVTGELDQATIDKLKKFQGD